MRKPAIGTLIKYTKINFVLSNVLPNFGDKNADGNDLSGNANTINGDLNSIKHYIGELFFLRACEYFKRYQLFGDFPIITHPLLDDKEALSEASNDHHAISGSLYSK